MKIIGEIEGAIENLPNQAAPSKNRITFINLLKGNIALYTTYWVFGCLVSLILRLIDKAIEYNYFSLLFKYEIFAPSVVAFFWIQITYSLFISRCIWNSALKYKGKQIWAILAMLVAIIVAIQAIFSILMFDPSRTYLEHEVRMMNAELPAKVNDETECEFVDLVDRNIIFHYKLINFLIDDFDVDSVHNEVAAKLRQSACSTKKTRTFPAPHPALRATLSRERRRG